MTRFHVLSGVDRLHTVDDLLKGRRGGPDDQSHGHRP